MALLAMQQMALMFKGLKPGFVIVSSTAAIQDQLDRKQVLIWSPGLIELDNAGIQASWDITSDSLAAWLANTLSATELLLIKSAAIDDSLNLDQLAEQDIVDKAFRDFVVQATFKVHIINAQNYKAGITLI
jgi:aspartokinase-like uncharacterized kinase